MNDHQNEIRIKATRRHYHWTPGLDAILESGYRNGPAASRLAIKKIRRFTGWPRQACWDRARKLRLSLRRPYQIRRWSEDEEEALLRFAGTKNLREIAKLLKRTRDSLRAKLKTITIGNRVGVSAKVQEGTSKKVLAAYLHRSPRTIQRWIDNGWLKARYAGKERNDDTLIIMDEDFRAFYKRHPWEVPFHTLKGEGLEYFLNVMFDLRNSQRFHPDKVEREKRKAKKDEQATDQDNSNEPD